ncbi:alpha/beta fold hydrolase [Streptomyces mirabilis]|uniref:alpha/beta fold hydrolase n=1 Tax=Streptomyces mirabilis TaxID=68239 RepID=UPI003247DA44
MISSLMDHLGHERTALIGHDRGARVGTRLAKDHRDRIDRFVALDNIPTRIVADTYDVTLARQGYWFFTFRRAASSLRRISGRRVSPGMYAFGLCRLCRLCSVPSGPLSVAPLDRARSSGVQCQELSGRSCAEPDDECCRGDGVREDGAAPAATGGDSPGVPSAPEGLSPTVASARP